MGIPATTARTPARMETGVDALILGGLGVLCFSFTLPATHLAVAAFGSEIVGLGRGVVAALFAAITLVMRREALPPRHTWLGLAVVAAGVVIGFPLFSSLALTGTPVAHSAIFNGLLPVATAIVAVVRVKERVAPLFWACCAAGTGAVVLFAFAQGGGRFHAGDWWMIGAISAGAFGYAEGGRLARELGGWRVICWALIVAFPITAPPTIWAVTLHGLHGSLAAWSGLGYVAVFSMFLGFFAWYHALAKGGIAHIGQLQLLQPLLTIAWAALFLGEALNWLIGMTALFVALCVGVGQRTRRQSTRPAVITTGEAV
jgi:drug/metabolite transporter (DMT)-like permease